MTLYTYDKDSEGQSACSGQCAKNWPPLAAAQGAQASGDWSLVAREDGTQQWAYYGKPLYTFIQDKKPGDKNGDGKMGAWHVAQPDMHSKPVLGREEVARVLGAAREEAQRQGWAVSIAVVDDGGHPLALERLDGCAPIGAYIATEKARSAALGRRETKRYEDMLDAEQVALDSGIPATRVRLAGIYGPGREWLLNQVRQGYRVVSEPPLYANRIHADDAAGLLAFLLRADAGGQALEDCYIGVDDAPVAMHEVVDYLRQRLGVSQWADEHSVRRAGSKRCSNRRARALGWVPRYPSYREGYAAVLGDA